MSTQDVPDEVFKALADEGRRRLLDALNARNGQTLRELCTELEELTRQSVSKHLAVLEQAGLVTTLRRGREKLHYLNAEPINAIADRWISRYDRGRVHALADLKRALEEKPVNGEQPFVYTTYIKTTAERLFQALTDPAFTRRYWGVEFETDWKPGSPMVWNERGALVDGTGQQVLEYDPPRRLAYTWHEPTRDWAGHAGIDEETLSRLAAEQRSRVSFEIEPLGELVKLTVVHDGFEAGSVLRGMIEQGWPAVVAALKTLLETGSELPKATAQPAAEERRAAAR